MLNWISISFNSSNTVYLPLHSIIILILSHIHSIHFYTLPYMLSTTLSLLVTALLSSAAPVDKRSTSGAVITVDFPDPALVSVDNKWWAFGTQSLYDNKQIHIQVASSSDFDSWSLHNGQDALPNLPGWVDQSNPLVWAPDIMHLVSEDRTSSMHGI